MNANVECKPAVVTAKIETAVDTAAAAKLKAALEKNLPALLKVTIGMKGKLESITASVKASLEGAQAVVTSDADAALKVGACFAASLKAQAEASVQINVSVKASASASGSVGAG